MENSVSELLSVTIFSIGISFSEMVPIWSSPSEQLKAVYESKLTVFLDFLFESYSWVIAVAAV